METKAMGENPAREDKAKKPQIRKIRFHFDESKSLADWLLLINDVDNAPLGAYTHKLITADIKDPNLNFDEAQKILEKAQFKNKLLRMSDDVYLNPVQSSFNAIARAMVILGFQSLRNIGICLGIYNHMLELCDDEPLKKEIVLSFHCAILTTLIAQRKAKILNSEPLMTAALTFSLGQIMFQFFGGESAKLYNEALETHSIVDESKEQEIVGFSLKKLTLELVKQWNLGAQAISVHEMVSPDNICYAVLLAREVTQNLRKGWQSTATLESMKKLKSFLNCTQDEVNHLIMHSLERVLEEVALYGDPQLMHYIPLPVDEE
ncbi:MAG: HDOD domain-containing protein [Candidatus Berkiella sp.]